MANLVFPLCLHKIVFTLCSTSAYSWYYDKNKDLLSAVLVQLQFKKTKCVIIQFITKTAISSNHNFDTVNTNAPG